MNQHLPAIIVTVPLLSAFVITAAGWLNKKLCFPIAIAALGVSLYCSISLLISVASGKIITYNLGGWAPPWGISYTVDPLNCLVLVAVASVAFINIIATKKNVEEEYPDKIGAFYTLYVLFATGLIGIVITGDAFNLYVLLEIAALTGYALLGMGSRRAPLASLNYIFLGTIGACFYLLGVGYLYIATGSLNMKDLSAILPAIYHSKTILFAFIICLTGLFIKMALFPMHAWLPNAYTYASSPATSLIAPLTTKVMVYAMLRITLDVFTPQYSFGTIGISHSIVWIAIIAIIMGSLMALAQRGLKKMLSYIIVAEVGYMVGGLWLGNRAGITGSILHIINDAAMTLCLFLAVGNIIYKTKTDSFDDLKGLLKKMPLTMGAFILGGLSIIGVPPTCGFFSKWYLISGGLAAGHYAFVAALLFSSLVNVVLFFRIIEIGFFEPFKEHVSGHHECITDQIAGNRIMIEEAPAGMVIPLVIVAGFLIFLGLMTGNIVTSIIQFAIPAGIS